MKKLLKYILYLFLLIFFTLFIIGIFNASKIKNGNLTFSKDWKGKFIKIDNENVRYLQKGRGKNILLIHGTPGSLEDWKPIIDSLSKSYKVTAFDRLGSGFTTAKIYNYTIEENVNFVNKLINKLNLNHVIIVGHSYGGSITTTMATQKNDMIKSFVVVAAPLYKINPDFTYKLLAAPIIGKGITILASKFVAERMIKDGLSNALGSLKNVLSNEFITTRIKLWSQPKVLYATSNVRTNYNNNLIKSAKNYKNINKKITFLVGGKDYKNIINDFNSIKKEVPKGEFIFLKNTTHYVQFQRVNKLINIILQHINTNNE